MAVMTRLGSQHPRRYAGVAWVFHNGRVYRQTDTEDKIMAVRLADGQNRAGDADEESGVATEEECFREGGLIRLLVDQDEVCRETVAVVPCMLSPWMISDGSANA